MSANPAPRYGDNPFALAAIAGRNLKRDQAYDISISLTVPPSPANQAMGNFMVTVHLINAPHGKLVGASDSPRGTESPSKERLLHGADVLDTFRRPLILPYADPIASLASKILFLPLSALTTPTQAVVLTANMADRAPLGEAGRMPTLVFVEVEGGQNLQVYSTSLTLTAQLAGLRWLMHHCWASSFLVLTSAFWGVEVAFTGLAWLFLNRYVAYRRALASNAGEHKPNSSSPDVGNVNDQTGPGQVEGVSIKKEEDD